LFSVYAGRHRRLLGRRRHPPFTIQHWKTQIRRRRRFNSRSTYDLSTRVRRLPPPPFSRRFRIWQHSRTATTGMDKLGCCRIHILLDRFVRIRLSLDDALRHLASMCYLSIGNLLVIQSSFRFLLCVTSEPGEERERNAASSNQCRKGMFTDRDSTHTHMAASCVGLLLLVCMHIRMVQHLCLQAKISHFWGCYRFE
jgi:hypothetical protein